MPLSVIADVISLIFQRPHPHQCFGEAIAYYLEIRSADVHAGNAGVDTDPLSVSAIQPDVGYGNPTYHALTR